ncbi:MAG: alpha/beta hydrolase [Proteobacteria bacterium]|nr:alpha/beta hydrolase [Pseudomonadota bacterium]
MRFATTALGRLYALPRQLPATLAALLLPTLALADPVQIPGPAGPLEAERVAVPGAAHALVIIPGSGPTDRDGNSPGLGMGSDTLRLLAEGLAAEGVASLRIDKRGFFGSEGAIADPNDVTIAAYAEDARAWVREAAALAPCVWLAGHSEGGLVALAAAQDPPEALCGLILMAAPGRPLGRIMLEQVEANPANAPILEEMRGLIEGLEAGQTRDPATVSAPLQALFTEGQQRYMIDLFAQDPAALARGWDGPALIVQGDADLQITPRDAEVLAEAMPQARRLPLPGGTHLLKEDVAGQPFATYTDPSLPLHPALVPGIADFLAGVE